MSNRLEHLQTLRAEALAELAEVNTEIENVKFFLAGLPIRSDRIIYEHRLHTANGRKGQLIKELKKLAGEIEVAENHQYPPVARPLIS